MSHNRSHVKKIQICSTSPGYPVYCPKCTSTNVLIFYDPRFTPRLQSKWDDLIDEKRILLENRWEKIKDENQWDKLEKGSEKPNWICKDCYDGGVILEYDIDVKILNEFKKYEKTFDEKSEPLYWDKCGEKVTLKQIQKNANVGDNSLALIAVTRGQYDTSNFSKYREHIKNSLDKDAIYYGLWYNEESSAVEYEIAYTVEDDLQEIQKHLNLHNQINDGVTQKMALVVDKDGNWKTQNNERYVQRASNSLGDI